MFHSTKENQRICIATFHMDGEATKWVTWHNKDTPFINWIDFKYHVCYIFATYSAKRWTSIITLLSPRYNKCPLWQTSFKSLRTWQIDLKPDLGREVRSFNPHTILEAKTLAKRHEDKFLSSKTTCSWAQSLSSTTASNEQPTKPKNQPPRVKQLSAKEI